MSTQISEYNPIESHVSLILRSKTGNFWETTSVVLFDYTESLQIPECYAYLQRCHIKTSSDICAYICARSSIEDEFLFEKEQDARIIPPLFRFYRKEITISDFQDELISVNNEPESKSDIIGSLIQNLQNKNFQDYESDEQIIDDVMEMISEKIGGAPFDYELAKEINVPADLIPVSEIQSVFFKCSNVGYIDCWEFDPQDDAEEFANDAKTSAESPHYEYLLSKWYKYKFEHYPALQYEDQHADGLVRVREFYGHLYVEDALESGNIEDLFSKSWQENHEMNYSFDGRDYNYRSSFDPFYEEDDGGGEYDDYKKFKKLREQYTDTEKFESEMEDVDWDFISDFWRIGFLRDSIDLASAEITAIILNSENMHLTDDELEYLIDYAAESGKTEHTACLLNYKNEKTGTEE